MHPTKKKFDDCIQREELTTGDALPLDFTFRELEWLYFNGDIYEQDEQFRVVVRIAFIPPNRCNTQVMMPTWEGGFIPLPQLSL